METKNNKGAGFNELPSRRQSPDARNGCVLSSKTNRPLAFMVRRKTASLFSLSRKRPLNSSRALTWKSGARSCGFRQAGFAKASLPYFGTPLRSANEQGIN
jgi:hypothetical protein